MILAIVHPGIVIAVDKGSAANRDVSIILNLTTTCSIQVGSSNCTVILDNRKRVLNRNLTANRHRTAIHQPAITVGRELACHNSTVIEDMQTIVELQFAIGYQLGAFSDIDIGVLLQVARAIIFSKGERGSFYQVQLRMTIEIEASIAKVAIALDI